MDTLSATDVQMPPILCWHHAPDEYGDIGMGGGSMGGTGEGEIRDESGLGGGAGVTGNEQSCDKDTGDNGFADVIATDVDDDVNLDAVIFAGPGAGAEGSTGGEAESATPGMAVGNTGLDPMQGGVDFESGSNMSEPGDTGGIDVHALGTGATGESNTAAGNASGVEEENPGSS
jgi:hypothetical protein